MGGETKQAKHKDNEPGWVIQSGSGSGGVAELVENLDKDAVQYGLCKSPSFFFVFFFFAVVPTHSPFLFSPLWSPSVCSVRISQKIDLSTTVKFVYIYYVGENVPFVKQGRIGIVHGDAKRYFSVSLHRERERERE